MRALSAVVLLAASFFTGGNVSGAKAEIPSVPGYKSVSVHYGWNKMLLDALVNGREARFAIDTGASFSVFDESRARAFGVMPVGSSSGYGEFATINHQKHRVGYIRSLRAGAMDFGSGPMVLFNPSQLRGHSRLPGEYVDGIIGADILSHYKAVINCATEIVYFKVDSGARLRLANFAGSQHFTKVPLREEVSRGYTVPASVNGHPCRLLVDTGASYTIFNQQVARELGLSFRGTRMFGSFSDGVARKVSVGKASNLMIGDFPVRQQELAAVALPDFAIEHGGNVEVAGLIGMELLALNRGIIDFDSMNLFLK